MGIVGGGVVLGLAIYQDRQTYNRPWPSFASLQATPDLQLHGTVAFLTQSRPAGGATTRACARIAVASGAAAKDAYCWNSPGESVLATEVWLPDGRLLVTSFDAPVGENRVVPKWAKRVDVTSGAVETVAATEVGKGATPPKKIRSADGERIVATGKDGNATVTLVGPAGSRKVFEVKDSTPEWAIQSGPVFSPDDRWILMWDRNNLLLTSVGDRPITRVLAKGVAGGVFNYDVPTP